MVALEREMLLVWVSSPWGTEVPKTQAHRGDSQRWLVSGAQQPHCSLRVKKPCQSRQFSVQGPHLPSYVGSRLVGAKFTLLLSEMSAPRLWVLEVLKMSYLSIYSHWRRSVPTQGPVQSLMTISNRNCNQCPRQLMLSTEFFFFPDFKEGLLPWV